jgi:hypothetical protein
MNRKTTVVLATTVALLTSACATGPKIAAWTLKGPELITDDAQYSRDVYRCTQESRTSWSGGGTGLVGVAAMAGAQAQAQQAANKLFQMCMSAAGYRPVYQAEMDEALRAGFKGLTAEQVRARMTQGGTK